MEKTLQDLCREAKAAQNLTSRELSQLSGVPLSSVNNFFASASKAPALSTVAPLCRVCGVSLDRFFGISEFVPPEDRLAEMTQGHETELELALLQGRIEELTRLLDRLERRDRRQKVRFYILLTLCTVLSCLLIGYLAFDASIPDGGLVRDGQATIFAWVVIVLLSVSVGVLVSTLLRALKYSRDRMPFHREENPTDDT
nr:MAG TPA: Transcriptional regulator BINDING, PHEROMONE BINDING, REPEAT [Caudoviricetes sp.]